MVDSRGDVVPAAVRSRNAVGLAGFILSLLGLSFFWVPPSGVLLWALGIGVSFAGCFRHPRGFGISGLFVSLLCFGFMGYFLVLPEWIADPVENMMSGTVVPEEKATAGAETPSAPRTLSDILSSFRYGNPADGESAAPEQVAETASGAGEPSVVSDEAYSPEIPVAENVSEVRATPGVPVARLPIARFAEISAHRTTWPRTVRLTRSRTISLWDSERKEIMGKMKIPAKTVVEVLDVRADGSLFVLDCTGQAFSLLAADTDFARAYAEKNESGN